MALEDSSPPTASDSHVCNQQELDVDSNTVLWSVMHTLLAYTVYVHVECVITSYLASSPLRRPMLWAVSVIWGSRLEGSPICGFCSYTPFIFSSASLRSRDRKVLFVLQMWALIKEVSLLCSSADKNRKDGQMILQSSFSTLNWENVFVFCAEETWHVQTGKGFSQKCWCQMRRTLLSKIQYHCTPQLWNFP